MLMAMLEGPQERARLDVGSLLLAQHAYQDLDPREEMAKLDDLAARVAEPTLDGLRRLLFDELGYTGDGANYYHPRNSFLNQVVMRRRGLPISLAVLMIEVGRRVGVPLDGVGMPGHFLVRDRVLPDLFIDPFAGGKTLDAKGCEAIFRTFAGPKAPFRADYLRPVSTQDILTRMVANLVNAYRRQGDLVGLGWSSSLRSRLPGVSPAEKVQLAQSLSSAGRWNEAASLLDEAADRLKSTEAQDWHQEAMRLRSRFN